MSSKLGQILVVVLMSAVTLGSISVTGLLQSTERIDASGIIIRPLNESSENNTILSFSSTPPPPEPKIEIDIFSNQACTELMTDVEWGEIEAGGKSNVHIFIKNRGDTDVIISLITENWSSSMAENNMDLVWNYNGIPIKPNEVTAVTLTLSVDPDCQELNSFGFDIIIIGS